MVVYLCSATPNFSKIQKIMHNISHTQIHKYCKKNLKNTICIEASIAAKWDLRAVGGTFTIIFQNFMFISDITGKEINTC